MPEEDKLAFKPVEPEDYDRLYPYTSSFGEGSCQHSPVSMYSLSEKYGDSFCIEDNVLYTLRSRLCDDTYRVYLAPLCKGDRKEAFSRIIADAQSYGKKAKFVTLTELAADALKSAFPDKFDYEENRDLAEYLYRSGEMAEFSGKDLRKRRAEVHTFWNTFGERAVISRMQPSDFEDCLAYEQKWLKDNLETHDKETLMRDARMIEKQMAHFFELHLSGVILRIDGTTCGFCYGTKLGDTYDVIVEKADRSVPHSYKVIRQESAKQCASDCDFVNMEEDVGVPGLRALKYAYKPVRLLQKMIATQRGRI
ncbi:MAG: DUF2156 domain-containing protein [Spirochaetales bacterium]|nr:DUF2156 domain-containing protein [Spirochaetales bacterium]